MSEPPLRQKLGNLLEQALEQTLFRMRWLMAPVYLGLGLSLVALVWTFLKELVLEFSHLGELESDGAIVATLSLIDLALAGNLILIVIFSGYESFVSRIDTRNHEDRPAWMGSIGFSELKIKLIASLVAISAVALLRALWKRSQGEDVAGIPLYWLIAIHLTFVVSGVLLALMDWLSSKASGGKH